MVISVPVSRELARGRAEAEAKGKCRGTSVPAPDQPKVPAARVKSWPSKTGGEG